MKPDPRNRSVAASRRRFMALGGTVCASSAAQIASAGTVSGTAVALAKSLQTAAPKLTASPCAAARFRACLGSVFHVRSLVHDLPPVALTLARVEPSPFPSPASTATREAFSIDLASANAPLAQDTYLVSHPDMGEFIALLVPTADGRTLVGVFDTTA